MADIVNEMTRIYFEYLDKLRSEAFDEGFRLGVAMSTEDAPQD